MIKILTVEQTRQAEASADAGGYAYASMMDDAGRAVALRAAELLEDRPAAKVTILVGAGNNGGDGLVAGRALAMTLPDAQVRLYLLTRRDDSDTVYRAAVDAGLFIAYADDDSDGRVLRHMVASADLVIDALFGIGVRLPLKDAPARLLRTARQAINERANARRDAVLIDSTRGGQVERPPKTYVLAVDCPSGVNCDTGEIDALTLPADETITFIAAKRGLLTFPAAAAVGRLLVAPLNFPDDLAVPARDNSQHSLLDLDTVRQWLPPRPLDGHKGTFGRALIVGGSSNYYGAVGLSARAAYASGVGLTAVAAPAHVIQVLAPTLLEAIWTPLPDHEGAITPDALPLLTQEAAHSESMLIGPGMGRADTTRDFVTALLDHALPPLVIDADGLTVLSTFDQWPSRLPEETILTPHPGEMARLCGVSLESLKQRERITLAQEKAAEWRCIVVLKGAHTVIAAPDGRVAVSPFKNPALAKGGTGDVLAGLIAGLRAQKINAFEAACVGVYVHGLAGEIAASGAMSSARSVLAGDVADYIADALGRVEMG